jgi:hypothetical protein
MMGPSYEGSDSAASRLLGYFSPPTNSSASPARVDGWRQVCIAFAARRAPPGQRQGGPWGLKT